ncbi:MAG: HAMP domain-containing histidine kinase [Burkholderiales bacterium]|nr:HAMP domain-containing histidine kinase [Anaerolineae bacterium]
MIHDKASRAVIPMTLRTKLILWYCGLLVILVVFIGGAAFATMRWTLVSEIDRTLGDTAEQVIRNSRAFLVGEFSGPQAIQVRLPSLDIFRASGVYVQVWDQLQGEPRFAASSTNLSEFHEPLDARTLGAQEPTFNNVTVDETDLRVLTRPVFGLQGQLFGSIQVAASLQTVNQATDRLLVIMLIGGGLSILLSVAVGLWLSSMALNPIKKVTLAAERIAATDDLGTRLSWNGPMDELGQLTSVFNRMMDRLEHLFNVQRRFAADVSHELRTPLTAMRGNIEIIQRYGMDDDALEAVHSEVERMSRLVNDLLLLARADYGGLTLELAVLDLDTVVMEAYRETQAFIRGKERDLNVVIDRFEPVRVNGNSDRIKQLLLNLTSNAIKFTPDGGSITLSLYQDNGRAILKVKDSGIGISPEDVQQIFERFFQAGPNSAARGDGFGLGLSIAKWIVEAHGGSISVSSDYGKGTTFSISLPVLHADTLKMRIPELPKRRRNLSDIVRRTPQKDTPPTASRKRQPER